ncbi:PAS domain S-box protein [Halorubrum sp. BOL3-1]|uniref:hybrid sensor histidine kinase/response regulator n=1 Tax=Halorubrum sp. BOL3-1 TaxID=2497325 RepID=UPI001004EC6C|nr:PAS domain S-box protein [Halorubrum sp. BOL3-1]QAU14155.1 PAS domain S-box protein [Halorubrum sp. BOL3-1]
MSLSGTKINVVYVDDDLDFAEMAAEFVERHDERIDVQTASSTSEGLDRLAEDEFDCVVSDYDMPEKNGVEFLKAMRESHPEVPFILFTGKGSEEVASKAISAGATDYLQKGPGTSQYEILVNRITNAVEQRRTRKEVARTEQRLRTIAENTTDVLWMFSTDWDELLFINSPYEEIWGRSIDELHEEPRSFLEGTHPEDRDLVKEAMAQLSAGEPVNIEYRVNADEDYSRWVWVQGQPLFGDGDEVGKVVGYAKDITERKNLKTDLEWYETLVNSSGDPMYIADTDGYFEYVNEALCEITGYEKEALIGGHVRKIMNEESLESAEKLIRSLLSSENQRGTFEMEGITKGGGSIPAENHLSLIFNGGKFQGTVGVVRDISERKDREQKLTALNDVAGDLITSKSVEQVCERTIEASEQILDFDMSVIALEDSGMLSPVAVSKNIPPAGMADMSVTQGISGKTYRTGKSFLINRMTAHEDADPQGPYKSAISLPIGDHGNFQAVATTSDAFDEKDLELGELLINHTENALERLAHEQRLQRQNLRLEKFANVVSHDLRNPLNVAQGRINIARENRKSEHLDAAADAVNRGFDLIDNLLDLARAEQDITDTEDVAVAELAEDCWNTVETGNAEIAVDIGSIVEANRSRLRQLFENLFRNSVEHGGENITVEVGSLPDGFYVADTGPGIPVEKREDVFEEGYSESQDGTGFGLAIVKQIVEAYGWKIRITDGQEGGARFEIFGVNDVSE